MNQKIIVHFHLIVQKEYEYRSLKCEIIVQKEYVLLGWVLKKGGLWTIGKIIDCRINMVLRFGLGNLMIWILTKYLT